MEYNDYELLNMAKDNNEDAINLLYKKYEPLFESKAKKYYNFLSKRGYDINDIKQEILISFDEVIKNYKEENNTLFYTFLNTCLENSLSSLARTSNTNKAKVLNSAISLDEPENDLIVNNFVSNSDPFLDILSKEAKDELYDKVVQTLTDFERKVFDLKLNNLTYLEIADLLEKKPKDIDNCLSRIKNKIKKIREELED